MTRGVDTVEHVGQQPLDRVVVVGLEHVRHRQVLPHPPHARRLVERGGMPAAAPHFEERQARAVRLLDAPGRADRAVHAGDQWPPGNRAGARPGRRSSRARRVSRRRGRRGPPTSRARRRGRRAPCSTPSWSITPSRHRSSCASHHGSVSTPCASSDARYAAIASSLRVADGEPRHVQREVVRELGERRARARAATSRRGWCDRRARGRGCPASSRRGGRSAACARARRTAATAPVGVARARGAAPGATVVSRRPSPPPRAAGPVRGSPSAASHASASGPKNE